MAKAKATNPEPAAAGDGDGKVGGVFDRVRRRRYAENVRDAVAARLLEKGKAKTILQAERMADDLSDNLIVEQSEKRKLPVGKIGDGAIIQWFIDHGPQIMALVDFLIKKFIGL